MEFWEHLSSTALKQALFKIAYKFRYTDADAIHLDS